MRPEGVWTDELKRFINENITNKMVGVEVGSYAGESTILFAQKCKLIHAVDMWVNWHCEHDSATNEGMEEVEKAFDLRCLNVKNINKIKTHSVGASELFKDNSLDFVYIDANHSYEAVKGDILLWKNKIKKGGFISGHDYPVNDYRLFIGVEKAVKEVLGAPHNVYNDSTWIFKF